MSSWADVLPGHPGNCTSAETWPSPEYELVARRVEKEYQDRFAAYRFLIQIEPIKGDFAVKRRLFGGTRFAALGGPREDVGLEIGHYEHEGVAFRIWPVPGHDPPGWYDLAEAEADMYVQHRRESETEWTIVFPPDEVDRLLREQADSYLQVLTEAQSHDEP